MASSSPRLNGAFLAAKQEFLMSVGDPALSKSISTITSIDDINGFLLQLEEAQSKTHGLRDLQRIKPFLDGLEQFAGVIEQFVSIKPEIGAVIWGPIKLLLKVADNTLASYDAIVNTMGLIGERLPFFQQYTDLFKESDRVRDVLVLFYRDILDFYAIALKFFKAKHWKTVFGFAWPRHRERINIVVDNIERHSLLLTASVNFEHIREAHDARIEEFRKWEKTFEFQEEQSLRGIQTDISPTLYDEELDRLRMSTCARTGKWLAKEKTLNYWFDKNNSTSRLVWLHGGPGEGKTYLSSMIIERAIQSSHTTLFAFLSYRQASVKTISIFHSLIFQLVTSDEIDKTLRRDLRARLHEIFLSSQRSLKSNTKFVCETLSELLKCVGQSHIIIDGLDEIVELERGIITGELLKILQECPEVRILISSRHEDDLRMALNVSKYKAIRAADNNSGCIQAYVSITTQEWLEETSFNELERTEINRSVARLSSKARGMFLYARVVMDHLKMCHSLEMIQRELEVLPENLHEAYARVLQRLNDLHPTSKDLCRRALGWIGCSSIPLQLQELSFALSIIPGSESNLLGSPTSINVLRLCGPIVEVCGNYVQFVHFTVKEYLFNLPTATFVQSLDATLDIALTVLTYLSLDIFDVDISEEQISRNIITGAYCLHWFATFQLLEILNRSLELLDGRPPPAKLIDLLERFIEERENLDFEGGSSSVTKNATFEPLKDLPHIRDFLGHFVALCQLDTGTWKLESPYDPLSTQLRVPPWTKRDPTTLSFTSCVLHQKFEQILCHGKEHMERCNCEILQRLYGTRLFRCHYSLCQSWRTSFEAEVDRESHCKNHDRPFTCPYLGCEFNTLGFISDSQLRRHQAQCHATAPRKQISGMEDPDPDELIPLLFDLISLGMVNEIKRLSTRISQLDPNTQYSLLAESSRCGSISMVESIFKSCTLTAHQATLVISEQSIQHGNSEVFAWIAPMAKENARGDSLRKVSIYAINTDSPAIFDTWKSVFSDALCSYYPRKHGAPYWDLELAWQPYTIMDTLIEEIEDPVKQERLADIWREQAAKNYFDKSQLGNALLAVSRTTCSIPLARALIEVGADINFQDIPPPEVKLGTYAQKTVKSPLHEATLKATSQAATFIKFLLLQGANPDLDCNTKNLMYPNKANPSTIKTPGMNNGAKRIAKWLGMDWKELVKWASEQRLHCSNN
ncbi:uncharacterized protein BO87DRAFT_351111 [Aspergillus neoniger CBS 115656]|uniref:NACHT domain-containing protein n=1 Tax=Aspergillus neoniger (strain CBS 115656) TaxID=1448310 RepID=A0A318YWH3_ASPNB|nr:hypothetical protein BO87DRAFT_351111 [Aspergillus neoniger CBS 115656]PYH38327.1 hypothetical protein BO87DRAFT_351111 [Aspergillus neoniger CBS 115656]